MKKTQFPILIALVAVTLLALLSAVPALKPHAQTVDAAAEQAERQAQSVAQGGGILDTLERMKEAQSQQLEGTWKVILTPILPPGAPPLGPFTVYGSFARGGVFIGSSRSNDLSPSSGPQQGVWEHRGGNNFAFTFEQAMYDAMGKASGILIADSKLTITGKDEFVGVTGSQVRDANGNLFFSLGCATLKGTRMKIGSLADQC